ncbi:cytochrome b [Affinirhizobium pseudoryzae]|uniref:cytochrome b n=1 Tax=Allorhizobium pseudoryzae TaxID=379684 RepID=UPI0013EAE09E|nr:cytochrome b [Allorhizobium pseudoryzae]
MEASAYAPTLRLLHWLVATLVLSVWPLGFMIKFVRDEVKLDFYMLHESLGFIVLWLMLVRIGARLTSCAPSALTDGIERHVANVVHVLLYLFLIVMPLSGFLATNAHGFPLHWFNLVPIWSPIGKAPEIAPVFSAIHEWSSWILLGLFALHIAGVIFHHVIRRDGTLYRIL